MGSSDSSPSELPRTARSDAVEIVSACSSGMNPASALDRQPLLIEPGTLLSSVLQQMSQAKGSLGETQDSPARGRVSYALVVSEGRPLGIVTERDVVRLTARGLAIQGLRVEDVMTRQLITLPEHQLEDCLTVLSLLRQHRIRHLPIVDRDGLLVGVATPASIRQALQPTVLLKLRQISEVMTAQVVTAPGDSPIIELAQRMAEHRVSCVVIVEPLPGSGSLSSETLAEAPCRASPQHPIGIVTERDIVQFQALDLDLHAFEAQAVMSCPLRCLQPNDSLWAAQQIMQQLHVRRLVIAEADGRLAGILTQTGFLSLLNPVEMCNTVEVLQQQVTQLTDERVELLQRHNQRLTREMAERRSIEQQLFREKELAQVTLQSIGDAVITTDERGCVTYLNPIAEELTGWPCGEAVSRPLSEIFVILHETTRENVENPVERVLSSGQISGLANHTVLIARNGVEYGIDDSAAPLRNRNGDMMGTVMVFRDVTHSRQIAQQLSWQAGHDAMTGLVNRRCFEQSLDDAIATTQNGQQHVLCYLDLDQFKVVNDTCGHTAGDELLRQVSALLNRQVRNTDILARLGGDEFGLLLHQCSQGQATVIADKIRAAIQDFQFIWDAMTFRIGASIGLVTIDQNSVDVIATMNAADAACYTAKSRGRNRLQVYEANDAEIIKQRGQQQWSLRIKQALEESRFCLYEQAIAPVNDADKKPHAEILLRMLDEDGSLIAPGAFIPAAERYNLMNEIDQWVIRTFLATPQAQTAQSYMINLSGASIGDQEFLAFLKEQMAVVPIDPQTICFEVTETAAIANLNLALDFIRELKQLGFRFALDDFGSGMSSFGYLKALPIDYLKIDGHFVIDLDHDSTACAIVESINHIGHVMGLKTIAESVESTTIQAALGQIGVDFIQGYAVARPIPLGQHGLR